VYITECLYGSNTDYLLEHLKSDRVVHIPVRAYTAAWAKENLMNIAVQHMPQNSHKIAFLDSDIRYRKPGWATRINHALDLYQVVQPWSTALDLGPHDQVLQVFHSFAKQWHNNKPIVPQGSKFWTSAYNEYPHPGYGIAFQRNVLNDIGGLLEFSAMGSGDHTMWCALVGKWQQAVRKDASQDYKDVVETWASRVTFHIGGKVGYTGDTIEHPWHGKKANRKYQDRWDLFISHGFEPSRDLKKNTHGVIEFAGKNKRLELDWLNYLRARDEDINSLN